MKIICVFLFPISFLLTGCDNAIQQVKDMSPPGFSQYTYEQLLDHRDVCQSMAWSTENTAHQHVIYTCELKKGKRRFNYNESTQQKIYTARYQQESELLENQAQSLRIHNQEALTEINKQIQSRTALIRSENNVFELGPLDEFEKRIIGRAFTSYFQHNKDTPEIQNLISTLTDGYIPFNTFENYHELYLYFHHPSMDTRVKLGLNAKKSLDATTCTFEEHSKQKTAYRDEILHNSQLINIEKEKYEQEMKALCQREAERFSSYHMAYNLKECEDSVHFDKGSFAEMYAENKFEDNEQQHFQKAKEVCGKRIYDTWLKFDETLLLMSHEMKKDIHNLAEKDITQLKQQAAAIQEKLNNLALEKQNKIIDTQAKLAAENAVKYYRQQHPDKGVEKIVWEYNKGTNSYFLKEKQLIEETKDGEVISIQPLDMSQLIAGSLRNIDNVDDYMAMDDPFRLPPISAQ